MSRFLIFVFLFVATVWAAKPMEPLTNYNVILVHGATDGVSNGFGCNDSAAITPYAFKKHYRENPVDSGATKASPWQLGGAPGMLGAYNKVEKEHTC
jgi:hypothetical protein